MRHIPEPKHTLEWERARVERFLELWGPCPPDHDHRGGRENGRSLRNRDNASVKNCPYLVEALSRLEDEVPLAAAS